MAARALLLVASMLLPVAWARVGSVVALLGCAGPLLGGCATQGADETPSLVAVVPAAPVIVQNETYVTQVRVEPLTDTDVPAPAPVVRPPDPGCVPDDTACLEAACARGSGHGCEARGDLYRERMDLQALLFYGRALQAYRAACARGETEACADRTRLSAPGYGAHLYIAEPAGCPEGDVMSSYGCVAAGSSSGPIGTTVVINGNHNVVQVFGSAAKVVGKSTRKGRSPGSLDGP